ncbi:MAG: hypothetical protein U0133_09985 [Gemmatimonadales bacterium]
MSRNIRLAAVAIAFTGLLAACSDGSAPTTRSQVRFNLASGPASGLAFLSDTFATSSDTLVLDSVQLVLRDIKFQRADESMCDDNHDGIDDDGEDGPGHTLRIASLHDDGGSDDGDNGQSDACESFNAGPFLLDVPLDTTVAKGFSVAVDTGTYKQVRIKIHKPEDDSADAKDAAFLAAHPEFNKVSVRVVGTFNGQAFTYTGALEAKQRMDLVPPLVVADSSQNVDVTIKVDVSSWFANGSGGLVDPASAAKGGANENLVRDNIRASFRAFRDENRDGHDDDGPGHD